MDPAQNIARLTEREKEVLRAWLDHKTAKEIALELGISHHAVEKRLKMARTKLDVATSLDAARLLADAEGYGQTATASPDLASKPSVNHISVWSSQLMARKWRLATMVIVSVTAAALLLSSQSSPAADPEAVAAALEGSLEQQVAASRSMFEAMDEDASGSLSQDEFVDPYQGILSQTDASERTLVIVKPGETSGRVADPETVTIGQPSEEFLERRRAMFALIDRNSDGEISQEEFTTGQLEGIGPRSFTITLAQE